MQSSVYTEITYILQPTWKIEMLKRRRPQQWIAPGISQFYRFSISIDRGKETHTYDTAPALPEFLLFPKKFANPPLYAHRRARDDAIRAATVPAIASSAALLCPSNIHPIECTHSADFRSWTPTFLRRLVDIKNAGSVDSAPRQKN